jgi:hypothetical protein
MQSENHEKLYSPADIDRVIAQFGEKLPEAQKDKIRETLSKEKEKFQAMEQLRERQNEHKRQGGRSR